MFNEFPQPIIFAHRGASAHAPENTLASFELALRQGADGIELDAKLSADSHVIVMHDQTVDRTTDGTGRVNKLTLAELRKLDAGSHFDVAYQGEPIPTLEEVFKAVGQLTMINVELTNYATPTDRLPEKVAVLVRRYKLSRRVLFSSFNPFALNRIRHLLPECPIGLLAMSGSKGAWTHTWLARKLVRYQTLHPELRDVTPKLVEYAHKFGYPILVYTVNSKDDIRKLFDMGVNGIFTDDPKLAMEIRSGVQKV